MPESGRLVILDRLRFVNDNKAEMLVLERLHRAAKAAVGREHNVPRRLRQITLGAVEERYRQVRCKPRDLTLPVCEQRGRHDDEHLLDIQLAVEAQLFEHRDDLKRLAEAHVVGYDGPHARAQIAHEPGIASHLIGTQRRLNRVGHIERLFGKKPVESRLQACTQTHAVGADAARERSADELGLRELALTVKFAANGTQEPLVDVHVRIAKAHDTPCLLGEPLELFFRHRVLARRQTPVERHRIDDVEKTSTFEDILLHIQIERRLRAQEVPERSRQNGLHAE